MNIEFVSPMTAKSRIRREWILKLPLKQLGILLDLYDPKVGSRVINWFFSKTVVEIYVDEEWKPFKLQPRIVHNDYGFNAYGQLVYIKGYGVVYR